MSIEAFRARFTFVLPLVQMLLFVDDQISFRDKTFPAKGTHVAPNAVMVFYVLHEIGGVAKATVTSRTNERAYVLTFHTVLLHTVLHEERT